MTIKELKQLINKIPEDNEKILLCGDVIRHKDNPVKIASIDWMEVSDGILFFVN